MVILKLYRKRIIPAECILLKDDEIVYSDDEVLITKWKTINPKTEFDHGSSVYIYEKGLQSAKFSMATAVGLFQSAVGFLLVLITDRIAKSLGEEGLM